VPAWWWEARVFVTMACLLPSPKAVLGPGTADSPTGIYYYQNVYIMAIMNSFKNLEKSPANHEYEK